MANRTITQLRPKIIDIKDIIPIQDKDGAFEAKYTTLSSLIPLAVTTITSSNAVIAVTPNFSTLYSLNPLASADSTHQNVLYGVAPDNIFFGEDAMSGSISGSLTWGSSYYPSDNLVMGFEAGKLSMGMISSNVFGRQAAKSSTEAWQINAFGKSTAQGSQFLGSSNFFGFYAGYSSGNGPNLDNEFGTMFAGTYWSNYYGYNAGYSGSNAPIGVFIGQAAGYKTDMCWHPLFIGAGAGAFATKAMGCVAIGNNAGRGYQGYNDPSAGLSRQLSVFLGTNAGGGVTGSYRGERSVLIGFNVGANVSTGRLNNSCIAIGKNITPPPVDASMNLGGVIFAYNVVSHLYYNQPAWPYASFPKYNPAGQIIGSPCVGIGTSDPQSTLHVNGDAKTTDDIIFENLLEFADDTDAGNYGLYSGILYRTGNILKIKL